MIWALSHRKQSVQSSNKLTLFTKEGLYNLLNLAKQDSIHSLPSKGLGGGLGLGWWVPQVTGGAQSSAEAPVRQTTQENHFLKIRVPSLEQRARNRWLHNCPSGTFQNPKPIPGWCMLIHLTPFVLLNSFFKKNLHFKKWLYRDIPCRILRNQPKNKDQEKTNNWYLWHHTCYHSLLAGLLWPK